MSYPARVITPVLGMELIGMDAVIAEDLLIIDTFAGTFGGTQNPNLFYASPNGSSGIPSFRAMVAADVPALPYLPNSTVIAQTIANATHKWINSYNAVTGLFTQTQPDYSDLTGTPQLAQTKASVASNWLNAYSATTGLFTASQPAFTDITGSITAAQEPSTTVNAVTNDTNVHGVISTQTLTLSWSGLLGLARGGNNADLSATGGASQVLKQVSLGAAVTVGQLAFTDISGTASTAQIPNLDASKITTGQIALARGGTAVDLSASGGTGFVLKQNSSHVISAAALVAADIPSLAASIITSGTLALAQGGTNANLSATGGASQVLKQVSSGAAITVGQLAFADISGSVAATQLPNPSATTLGGIESIAAVSHQWINSISTSGVPTLTQPAASDLSNGTTGSGSVVLAASPSITGTVALASATLSGLVSNYNSIATVANGVPAEYATVDLTAQSAAQSTTTLYAVPASGAGVYRVCWSAKFTRAATTSSTLGALTVTFTDPDGVTVTQTCAAMNNSGGIVTAATSNSTSTVIMGIPLTLNVKASTNITFAFAYASSGTTTMQYNLHIRLEAI
jgi:hypothetical protein